MVDDIYRGRVRIIEKQIKTSTTWTFQLEGLDDVFRYTTCKNTLICDNDDLIICTDKPSGGYRYAYYILNKTRGWGKYPKIEG